VFPGIRRQAAGGATGGGGKIPPREIKNMDSVHAAGFVEDVSDIEGQPGIYRSNPCGWWDAR
jgi:hypothetical protein